VSTASNQVTLGTSATTLVVPGVTSAASAAAQSGTTRFISTDAQGHAAASPYGPQDIASLSASVGGMAQSVAGLQQSVNAVQQDIPRAYEGTAIAIALGAAALPDNKRYAITANVGTFRGQSAFGGSAQLRVSDNLVLNAGIGAGFSEGGVGARIGATWAW
jgi:hypothetical protein